MGVEIPSSFKYKEYIMGTKKEELANPNSCINKAVDDEPIFVLRAQDKLAPILIRLWTDLANIHGCSENKRVQAWKCARDMEEWGLSNKVDFPS